MGQHSRTSSSASVPTHFRFHPLALKFHQRTTLLCLHCNLRKLLAFRFTLRTQWPTSASHRTNLGLVACPLTGCKLKIEGAENLHKSTHAVYASNHTSYMDTPVIFSALPFQFRIFARKPLFRIPFIGWHLARSGQIPIDTDNPRASLASLGHGIKTLRAGTSLFVFPEGGRTLTGNLRRFPPRRSLPRHPRQVPLVPIALIGIYDLLPMHTHHFYPGPLTLRVGEPIYTTGYTLAQSTS